ncbi:MAG: hypothetical protein ACPLZF_02210 [Nitrososphaeria archaeon]
MSIVDKDLEEANLFFNGITIWQTFYGNEVVRGHKRFDVVKEMAVNLAKDELN